MCGAPRSGLSVTGQVPAVEPATERPKGRRYAGTFRQFLVLSARNLDLGPIYLFDTSGRVDFVLRAWFWTGVDLPWPVGKITFAEASWGTDIHHGTWLRQALEDAFSIVIDLGGVTMHRALGPRDEAAEDLAHHLMAEADAEDGELAGVFAHDRHRLARLMRRAGAGRDDDGAGRRDILLRHLVVAHDARLLAHLLEIAGHVVDE